MKSTEPVKPRFFKLYLGALFVLAFAVSLWSISASPAEPKTDHPISPRATTGTSHPDLWIEHEGANVTKYLIETTNYFTGADKIIVGANRDDKGSLQVCGGNNACNRGTNHDGNYFQGDRTSVDWIVRGGTLGQNDTNFWLVKHPDVDRENGKYAIQYNDSNGMSQHTATQSFTYKEIGFDGDAPEVEIRKGGFDENNNPQFLLTFPNPTRYALNEDNLLIAGTEPLGTDSPPSFTVLSYRVDQTRRVKSDIVRVEAADEDNFVMRYVRSDTNLGREYIFRVGFDHTRNETDRNTGTNLNVRSGTVRIFAPLPLAAEKNEVNQLAISWEKPADENLEIDYWQYRVGYRTDDNRRNSDGTDNENYNIQSTWTSDWITICDDRLWETSEWDSDNRRRIFYLNYTIFSPESHATADCGPDSTQFLPVQYYRIQVRAVDEDRAENTVVRNHAHSEVITLRRKPNTVPTIPPTTIPPAPPVVPMFIPPSPGGGGAPTGGAPTGGGDVPPEGNQPDGGGGGGFTDSNGHTHETNIVQLASMGVTRGCNPPENSRFCPDRAVTRAEMATFLVRAFELPTTNEDPFTDTADNVHRLNINRMAAAGISRGCNPPTNTQFCPDRAVTRAEMATFMTRVLELTAEGGEFTDTADNVHAANISRFANAGITRGCNPPENSRFCPDRAVTRAEMATFLVRSTALNS